MKTILALTALLCAAAANATTLVPVQLLNPVGSTSGQAIVSTGASSAPAWSNVSATSLASQAANTVVANTTGSVASPTAFAMPSCSSSSSALQYTSGTGFTCYANSASLSGAAFTGFTSVATANANATFQVTDTGTNGANLKLLGNGATTPSKTIRAVGGVLNVVNDAYSANILNLTDAGVLTTLGGINNSPISGSTGSFTTLAASSTVSGAGFTTLLAPYAPLASPVLTGTPSAPTAASTTNTTQIATTAMVQSVLPAGFTAYSPVVSAASGTYTTASATGSYMKIGKLVCMQIAATITTIGTGTSTIVTLPFAAASGSGIQILAGRENSAGKMLQASIGSGASTMSIFDYTNASAAASGALEIVSGCYISS